MTGGYSNELTDEFIRIGARNGLCTSVLLKWRDRLDRKFRNRHGRDPRVCKLCLTKTHYQQGRLGRKKENVGDGYQIEYRSDYKGSSRFQNHMSEGVNCFDFIEFYNGYSSSASRYRAKWLGIQKVDKQKKKHSVRI